MRPLQHDSTGSAIPTPSALDARRRPLGRMRVASVLLVSLLLVSVLGLGGLLGVAPARAQEPTESLSNDGLSDDSLSDDGTSDDGASTESGIFVDTADVYVVNVDVYVTDRDGSRVTGLDRDDFVLTVDKRETPISNFYAVENARAPSTAVPVEQTGGTPADETGEAPSTESDGAQRTPIQDQQLHLIVYVDNFNIKPFSRNRVLRAARTFLRQSLNEGDRAMLVSYDRSLNVRHPFTSDPQLIGSALYELEELTGHRVGFDADRRAILSEIWDESRSGQDDTFYLRSKVIQYAESVYNDTAFSLDALREMVDMLAGLPGRKAILYVSDGIPMRSGEDIFYALDQRYNDSSLMLDAQRFDNSREFRSLIASANTHRVTFYTVDAEGLRTYGSIDAANATTGNSASLIDSTHISNLQAPLRTLAEETGGFAIVNTNGFDEPLERIGDDLDTYYSLGFVPAPDAKGRYHKIRVELKEKRRGVDLRFREGYRDKSLEQRMGEGTLAALHFGYQTNPLGVELEVGRGVANEDEQFFVPLAVKIPIGQLALLPREGAHRGRVRLFVAARDSEGGVADVQEIEVPIDIPSDEIEAARGAFYHYRMQLLMRPGRQTVAVGVRDELAASTSFVTGALRVGA